MEEISQGWVITNASQDQFYEFTFSRTRREAIKKWTRFWDKPNNWRGHYRKGHRCIKATSVITTE